MRRALRILPHAAILFANMYYVFYGIDRVNRQMNFIDNRLTKGLLALMCAAVALRWTTLRAAARRNRHRRDRHAVSAGALLLLAELILAAGFAVMLLIDWTAPARMPVRSEFAKAWLLALSAVSQVNAIRAAASDRAEMRDERFYARDSRPREHSAHARGHS